ncbi:CDP-glucose 4,6-dehydratase [Geobacter sulfurreducens]|uniref:CDP-glucose 4,6-dehydratase n=1 Tax=Geobacter metallireducens TaxID=28232 RepID=A0A831UAN4_GEOME|nr:CDP-glucose 4,6-dehydratase [Geobacter sulfurreducens]QVW34102.1 CDP-glucose 4,6-dehydratase [Geobacter sulfurreducens]
MDRDFWKGRKVFITGNTGFKGTWLCIWLNALGADVTGYALDPPTEPNLFDLSGIGRRITSLRGDVRDLEYLSRSVRDASPEIVFHMAAQPLVRDSYLDPVTTYATNVIGTVNLLEAVRKASGIRVVLNVTTDKCYENREWIWGYRENEPMGGYDPYSNSKACSELVTSAYRSSFFNPDGYCSHGVALASARAGNVIGGGDWARDRLVPDIIRALEANEKVQIRNPHAIRPWQHVLEPLFGYLLLAQRLWEDGPSYVGGWNFGPYDEDARSVEWIVKEICGKWGTSAGYEVAAGEHPHEARFLKLDCTKARVELGWRPRWNLEKSLERVVSWAMAHKSGEDLYRVCLDQIEEYHAS